MSDAADFQLGVARHVGGLASLEVAIANIEKEVRELETAGAIRGEICVPGWL